jgi:aryl-alcohol dehydrogenase-like predicted oxidoreductase
MIKRPYGKNGIELSIIGFGGIVVSQTEASEAAALVRSAVESGINYFDVAPSYGDAEQQLGPALEPFRSDVFLACKTTQRRRHEAEQELHASLKQMRTQHFDLYQLHAMTTREDLEQATGPGGALEALVAAKEQGLVRHLGFSAHSAEIAVELLDQFPFDSVLFPINWNQYFNADFGPQVVDKAIEKGASCLALKGMAFGKLKAGQDRRYAKCWYEPIDDAELAELALRFTLSQPITAAIPPGDARLFEKAVDIAGRFTPIREDEIEVLRARAVEAEPFFSAEAAG